MSSRTVRNDIQRQAVVALSWAVLAGCSSPSTPTAINDSQAHVQSIVAISDDVYWTDSGFDQHDVTVAQVMEAPSTVVADQQLCPGALATDQVSLFWARCDGVIGSSTGGTPTTLVAAGVFAANSIAAIAATTDTVYVATSGPDGEIVAVSTQPGGGITPLATQLSSPVAIAVDGTNVYWRDDADAAVYELARAAAPGTAPTKLASTTEGTTTRVIDAIATDGVHLYWSDAQDGHGHAMRISDGTTFDFTTSGTPDAFALDESYVYWISGVIERAPLAGGATETLSTIDDPSGYPAPAIAVTTDSVIWADNPSDCDPTIADCFPTTIESLPK